ncbi:alpha/beta hydrolase [Iningainema tapete]|uniref:Alpha/beta hydrolase n=1 Tax=Iningainema tapete BLCC-T55 TaxID=2748662 RepID=A0A8J6XJK0_9CYAN|nr:alpha/beta hydrolase [Iningainema tapete]MBD2774027.1 alpha/beta hydrolase [Iningainema tapete BLCC-T55]
MKTTTVASLVAVLLLIPAINLLALPGSSSIQVKMTTQPSFKNLVTGEVINQRLDPQALAVLTKVAQGGPPPTDIPGKRAAFNKIFNLLSGPPEAILKVENLTIASSGGKLPIRLYRPKEGKLPVLVYYHGGGFNKGDLNSHDAALRSLANRAGCLIVAVDYRRTPEHQFPAQIDDAFTTLKWVAENAARIGANAEKIAVGGDSVGGNLAAVTAMRSRDQKGPKLVFQLLMYPVTDVTLSSQSWQEFANGPWLTRDGEYEGFHKLYLPAGIDPKQPYVSPLFAPNLKGLPPALVVDGEFDPYRDEGQTYAKRLQAAGVPVTATVYPGMIHDFFLMAGATDAGKRLIQQSASALQNAFGSI